MYSLWEGIGLTMESHLHPGPPVLSTRLAADVCTADNNATHSMEAQILKKKDGFFGLQRSLMVCGRVLIAR